MQSKSKWGVPLHFNELGFPGHPDHPRDSRHIQITRGWSGVGVGVGMLRGRGFWVCWFLGFLVFGFLVSWFRSFLVPEFLGSKVPWSLGFWVSKFQSFLVSKFLGLFQSFKVSKIQRSHITQFQFHVFWKMLIPYSRFPKQYTDLYHVSVLAFSNNFKTNRIPQICDVPHHIFENDLGFLFPKQSFSCGGVLTSSV